MNFQERKYQLLTEKFEKKGHKIVNHQSGHLNLDAGEGRLPRVGEPEQYPQDYVGDVAEAIAYVQKVAETYPDEFAQWAAGANILNKVMAQCAGGNSQSQRSNANPDFISRQPN